MSKFKVGDKVRAFGTTVPIFFTEGTVVEILKNNKNTNPLNFDYLVKNDSEDRIGVYECELLPVEETILAPVKENDTKLSEPKNMGVRLNSGKLRWRNFPMFLMEPVIAVGSYAEKREGNPNGKYETFNFLKGMKVNDCMDSLKRHLMRFESPYESDNDDESTESHLAHIAWNALVALHMLKTRPELDDRYKLPVEHVDDDSISEEERYELAKALQDRGR